MYKWYIFVSDWFTSLSRMISRSIHVSADSNIYLFWLSNISVCVFVYMCVCVCVREGNGNPLQYSCLENPMDRGAWWAAVHGVVKRLMWLGDFTFTFHFHALEKEMATLSSVLAWRIPGTEEPGGLPSMGSHRVGDNWSDLAAAAAYIYMYLYCWCKSNCSFAVLNFAVWCWNTFLNKCGYVIHYFNANFFNFFLLMTLLVIYFIFILDYGNDVTQKANSRDFLIQVQNGS